MDAVQHRLPLLLCIQLEGFTSIPALTIGSSLRDINQNARLLSLGLSTKKRKKPSGGSSCEREGASTRNYKVFKESH
eukprot:1146818-Pelagomonas_calceolata.AAC.3